MGNVMLLAFGLYAGGHGQMDPQFRMFFRWISALLATLSLAWPGATFFRSAWAAIRLRAVNLDVPIAMALAVGSVAGLVNVVLNRGEIYFDSLTVLIFLLLIGRFLQYQQQRRADDAVGLLFNLTPSSCRIVNNGQALERPIESLAAGDLIEVWSGEIFPADGVVETGASSVNEALLTGESTPAAVSVGSPVHAGSQNVGGVLQVRVKSVGAGTRVGHLMRLVEQGVHDKPQIAQFTDKVGRWFVVIVAMAAVATFFFWLYHQGLSPAIDHSVALLIVTCPCVLGLATPMTIAIAIGKLARHDILVKSGVALERLSHGGSMVLDKTGTLTDGRLQLLGWVGDDSIKGVVAEMERRSVHPVGIALRDALSTCELDAASRVSLSGAVQMCDAGVIAKLGASSIHVGSPSFLAKHRIEIPDAMELAIAATEAAGLTAVGVASNGQVVAIAALGDRLREDSKASVARLRKMGWEPSILSGDAQTVVQSISRKVGIESEWALGRQTPEDKLRHVTHRNHDKVLVMVGDGVNDAAALAAADVGIAVHGGAEASLAAADVYIARPGLQGLVELAYTSRDVMRTIRRNLGISLTYNLFAGIMAATGLMTPLLAAIVMPVSSATVLGFAILSVTRIDRHWLKSQPQPTVEYEEGP
jgi:Cu2+-exporting ATPase